MKRILALIMIFMLLLQTTALGEQENTNGESDGESNSAEEISENVAGSEEGDAGENAESEGSAEDISEMGESGDNANVIGEISWEDIGQKEQYKFNFETVARNDEAELLIDKATNTLRLVSLKTGNYFDTKVMNGQLGSEYVKNIQKSDFVVSYYRDLAQGTTETWNNYTMSIELGQVEYEPIDNGIRCIFTVGDASKIHLDMFPMYISKDRMEKLVLQYLDDKQRQQLLGKQGYYTETKDKYIRNWESKTKDGSPTAVPIPVLKRMYNLFYEVGHYSAEELAIDNEMWGVQAENLNITFKMAVEYVLEGKDLVVRVPIDGIETDEKHPITELTLLPYLLSGGIQDEGYLFVPDGCGGIINLNNGKYLTEFSTYIFGSDPLYENGFYYEQFTPSTFPVVGIKKNNIAIMGIIEQGAEIATVSANVSGRVDEFNKATIKFNLFYSERVPLTIGFENYILKHADRGYDKDIVVRYKLLEGKDASYVGMAKEYRKYLEHKGEIKKNETPQQVPLFLEMIASVPREKVFLGIPYTSQVSLTSFDEAKNIVDTLKQKGVSDIVVQYTYWANGGVKNSAFNNLKVIRSIGGEQGLKRFISYSQQSDIPLFFTINMVTVYSTRGISKRNDIAKLINNTPAVKPGFNMVTKITDRVREWLISPSFFSRYTDSIIKWADKLGIEGLGLGEAGVLLYGDYGEKNQIMRWDALPMFQDAFEAMGEHGSLLFSNANSYVYKYADYITDLPVYGSGREIIDYNVPFVQMVLENNIVYSMPAFNEYSLENFEKYLLKAIETKSSLKWIVTAAEEKEFIPAYLSDDFRMRYYYRTQFKRWEEEIPHYYSLYNEFYQQVKDAEIDNHEIIDEDLVKVSYTNGVIVYLNYSTTEEKSIDGYVIKPLSYVIGK